MLHSVPDFMLLRAPGMAGMHMRNTHLLVNAQQSPAETRRHAWGTTHVGAQSRFKLQATCKYAHLHSCASLCEVSGEIVSPRVVRQLAISEQLLLFG